MSRVADVLDIGKQVYGDVRGKNVTFMAAGIAYNAFVSLAPLLVLLLVAVTLVGGGLESRVVEVAGSSLPGPIADVVSGVFSGESAGASASVVGLVVLVWGTLKVFRGLDTAFSEIYETESRNSLADQLIDGLVVLVALGVAVLATIGVSSVFAAFSDRVPGLGFLTPLVLLAGIVLAFLPMYYRFPDVDLGWRDVLPGAVVAAVGWAALQAVFQVYLAFRGGGTESFFGGVIVVVTWLYFSGLVLLLGAVLNAVVGGHSSGAPGGVGRGAAEGSSDVEARRSLTRDELAGYLRELRGRITGYHEELEPASEPTRRRRPETGEVETQLVGTITRVRPTGAPNDEVEVIERSRQDGDAHEMTITFRWRDGRGGAAD